MSAPPEAWLEILQAGQRSSSVWHAAFAHFGTAEAVRDATAQELRGLGLSNTTIRRLHDPDVECISAWHDWLSQSNHALLTRADATWPPRLAAAGDAPLALWLRGTQPALLAAPQLAIVGSRNATVGGRTNAQGFATALGNSGLTITSGLAAGIDAAAHAGALATASGTLAVLGCGIDQTYPQQNRGLATQIAAAGLIVSEYPPGMVPQRHYFPARNRIIAALSLGVLVVEAGPRSGSLITARLAAERGREVFAIPGSIHNPVARGCHRLIRDGAKLVESADDVLLELAPALRHELEQQENAATETAESARDNAVQSPPALAPEYRDLLAAIGFDPTEVSAIVAHSTLTTAEVSSMLLLLELEGHVEALPGGRYVRIY